MKKFTKILSTVLAVLMFITGLPLMAFAASNNAQDIIDPNMLPDIMDYDTALQNGLVSRNEYEESDLYSYIFENLFGQKTQITYQYPVKYMDASGAIRDKTNKIKQLGNKFIPEANNILSEFSSHLSEGIRLAHEDVNAVLIPAFGGSAPASLSLDGKTVSYVIDEATILQYSLTYMGYKEDIIVSHYAGRTSYSFYLYTNGLSVAEEYGSYFLVNDKGEKKANIGEVIVFTADERNNTFGELSVETLVDKHSYVLTIELDPEYLADEKTVYPIVIDPTLEIHGANTNSPIQDITVSNQATYSSSGKTLLVGRGTTGAIIRSAMNFGGVDWTSLQNKHVTAAQVEIRDIVCDSKAMTVQCYEYTGRAWSESNPLTWSESGNFGELLDQKSVYYGNGNTNTTGTCHWYSFDITSAAKRWAAGNGDPAKGVLFKATSAYETGTTYQDSEYPNKTFGSSNRSSYMPVIVIHYSDIVGISDHYTYDTQTLGDNLTVYTGHKYGNVVAVYNFPLNVSDFPLDIAMVYNSTRHGQSFYSNYGLDKTQYGDYGNGWKLSVAELLTYDSVNDIYTYVDGTGIDYALVYQSSGKYANAEIGANLKLTDTSLTLTLADDSKRVFNPTTYVLTTLIQNDSTYTYHYDNSGKRLRSISRDGKTLVSFSYSNGKLTTVGTCSLAYSGDELYQLKDKHQNPCTFIKQTAATGGISNLLFQDNLTAMAYRYDFNNGMVSRIRYYRSSLSYTLKNIGITYSVGSTVYTDEMIRTGADAPEALATAYVFGGDNRTVNMIVSSADGSVIYDAQQYEYAEDQTAGSVLGVGNGNFLVDSGFDLSTNTQSAWGNGITLNSSTKLWGANSLSLAGNQYVAQSVELAPNTYTLSAYVNATDVNADMSGFFMKVLDASSNVIAQSDSLLGVKTGEDWIRIFTTFTVTTQGTYTVRFGNENATGEVYVDCVQLEVGSSPTTYNALTNSDFENETAWSGGTIGSTQMFGSRCLMIAPGQSATKTVGFSFNTTTYGAALDRSLVVSGWCTAGTNDVTNAKIRLTYYYTNGTTQTQTVPFTDYVVGKQFASYTVESPAQTSGVFIHKIDVTLINNSDTTVYFDNLLLSFGDVIATEEEDGITYRTNLNFKTNGDGTCKLYNLGTDVIESDGNDDDDYYVAYVPSVSPAGDTVTSLGSQACRGYTVMDEIHFPSTVTAVGIECFHNNTAKHIHFEGNIAAIRARTFWNCTNLIDVNIPDSVAYIGDSAFNGCSSLQQIIIPEGATSIGTYSMSGCSSLKIVYIPATVTSIGKSCFSGTHSDLVIYYGGTQTQWNAISFGSSAIPSSAEVVYNCDYEDGVISRQQAHDDITISLYNANDEYTLTNLTEYKYLVLGEYSNGEMSEATEYSYIKDANGYVVSSTDEHDRTEYSVYDSNGNVTIHKAIDGAVTKYEYNSYGDVIKETNANQAVTTYTYYSNGLLKSMSCNKVTVSYTYENGQVKTIMQTEENDTQTDEKYTQTYTYTYNGYGNLLTVAVGNRTLVTYTYALGGAGNVISMTYANGYTEAYTYDAQGNMLTVKENGTLAYSYRYDLAGNVLVANDHKLGRTDAYFYTSDGYSSVVITYDNNGNVYTVSNADGTIRLPNGHQYISMPSGYSYSESGTDEYMRTLGMALSSGSSNSGGTTVFTVDYTYANKFTENVATEKFSDKTSNGEAVYHIYAYYYDMLGNLTSVAEDGILKISYQYDALCQLERENNVYAGMTYKWEYDAGGNITSKKEYSYTLGDLEGVMPQNAITYTYGDGDWKDLLTNYNGTAITYDASGNPLNWRNASAMTWDGRRLSSMTLTDGTAMSFAYNADGLRTRKTVGDETVEYVWMNGELISEIRDNYTLHFYYENGEVIGFNYKTNSTSSNYYYGKDTLGVIRYLYDASGTVVTTYTYDAWGRSIGCVGTLAGTIGAVNPIRYKSYYLDAETGFYYLQSRYYDPATSRFINEDDTIELGLTGKTVSYNLFAYCENNSIINLDSSGYGLFPVSGIGKLYKKYNEAVTNWASTYAPKSKGVEFGAIIYKVRKGFWTYYCLGETYKGFKTANWYTVINGLGAGYLTGVGRRNLSKMFWPILSVSIVGFAHTHPIGHDNLPSGPDIWMKRIGFIVGMKLFPIAVWKAQREGRYTRYYPSINYF